jgi:hypothetical protein
MISRVPFERKYPERLMLLEFQKITSALSKNGPLNSRDAKKLDVGIDRLEELRRQYTWAPLAFTLIGGLRHLRAIALANNKNLSDALAESRKGLDYCPDDQEAVKTDESLVANMKTLQTQMASVLHELQTGYNKRLTAEGQKLADEASKGFAPLNEYLESAERKQIQQDVFSATCKNLWLAIGYPEPAEEWDTAASKLYFTLSELANEKPSTQADMERLWQDLASKEPVIAALPPRPVLDFLADRLFPHEQQPTEVAAKTVLDEGPVFEFQSNKRVSGDEPFLFWLFSHQGFRLKIQSCAALAFLLIALSLVSFDALRRSDQNQMYSRLIAASQRQDFAAIVDASEQFLAHRALRPDERTDQVKSLYAEALVRWFSLIQGAPDEAALRRARRYQQLAVDQPRR